MPSPRWHLAVAVFAGCIFGIGGRENPLALERYDPELDSWARLDALKSPKPNPFSVTAGNRIYVLGGTESGKEDYPQLEELDPATGRWTRKTPMPTARTDIAVAARDESIYVMGGWTEGGLTGRVERYDTATDRWSACPSLPRARNFAGAAVARGGVYLVGGSVYQPDGSLVPIKDADVATL